MESVLAAKVNEDMQNSGVNADAVRSPFKALNLNCAGSASSLRSFVPSKDIILQQLKETTSCNNGSQSVLHLSAEQQHLHNNCQNPIICTQNLSQEADCSAAATATTEEEGSQLINANTVYNGQESKHQLKPKRSPEEDIANPHLLLEDVIFSNKLSSKSNTISDRERGVSAVSSFLTIQFSASEHHQNDFMDAIKVDSEPQIQIPKGSSAGNRVPTGASSSDATSQDTTTTVHDPDKSYCDLCIGLKAGSGGKHATGKVILGRASRISRSEVEGGSLLQPQLISPRSVRCLYRRNSPVAWFPRSKTTSYLERKIRMLQEKAGISASLDETLGASNLHLSRIEREKRAAAAAAREAMETRKAALVEASWCRILKAAGISYMLAAQELQKAEERASEALAAATALGVILRTKPRSRSPSPSPRLLTESTEPLTATQVSNHAITASFETAFEVDNDVAAAVKAALALNDARKSDATNHEFREDGNEEKISDSNGEIRKLLDERNMASGIFSTTREEMEHEGNRMLPSEATSRILLGDIESCPPSFHSLVSLMLERVKRLQPEQLSSLVTIVATRGLSALLKEENFEQELITVKNDKGGLGDVLVKHVSKLEAEKAAAAAALIREESLEDSHKRDSIVETVPDLGSVLIKRPPSKLEKEKQAAKELGKSKQMTFRKVSAEKISNEHSYQSLDQVLVKHMSKLEKEKLAARLVHEPSNLQTSEIISSQTEEYSCRSFSQSEGEEEGLDKLLFIKHASRLEKEKLQAANERVSTCFQMPVLTGTACGLNFEDEDVVNTLCVPGRIYSTETIIEKTKLIHPKIRQVLEDAESKTTSKAMQCEPPFVDTIPSCAFQQCHDLLSVNAANNASTSRLQEEVEHALFSGEIRPSYNSSLESDDNSKTIPFNVVGMRKLSKLEIEKQEAAALAASGQDPWLRKKCVKTQEVGDVWGGLSLGSAMKRHVSKLELEQAAWRRAEEEEARKKGFHVQ